MARERKPKKDPVSIVISVVLHVILIGGVGYWMHKTGKLEAIKETILKLAQSEKKDKSPEAPKPIESKPPPPQKLPEINQGYTPPRGGGTRRAVAEDAPDTGGGGSFFQDTRVQTSGPSTAGSGGGATTNKPPPVAPKPAAAPKPTAPTLLKAAPPSTIKAVLQERAKAAAAVESVSAEQITKSAVSDAGDIVARVSGATVVEGKYAVIRGLTDRYSAATLNGAELPSADPYRRSASLDMFPAKIIDRVSVTKTFTPDQPGSFTGGNINIVTKSFPEKPFFTLELGGAYNTQSSLNEDFLSYAGGSRDWLGMDDGTRSLPRELADPNLRLPPPRSSISITPATSQQGAERLRDNDLLDAHTERLGPAQFAATPDPSPLNHGFVLAGGSSGFLFGRPVGFFGSLPYGRSYSFYDDGVVNRSAYDTSGGVGQISETAGFREIKAVEEVNWAGTVSLGYQWADEHELGFNFIFNQYAEDSARVRMGWSQFAGDPQGSTNQTLHRLMWLERNLTTYQLRGADRFPDVADLKMDWLATLTDTSQDEPDIKFFGQREGRFGDANLDPSTPRRYFRNLEENNKNLKLDFTLPFNQWNWKPSEFKFGFFDSLSARDYRERLFQYGADNAFTAVPPNSFLPSDPTRLGYQEPPTVTYRTNRQTGVVTTNYAYVWPSYLDEAFDSTYSGQQTVLAGYAMVDLPVVEKLRLIGGARYELTDMEVNSFSTLPGPSAGASSQTLLDSVDILPAASLVYALRTNMNLRLSYGQTLARPSYRELALVQTYDPVLDEFLIGNAALRMTEVHNFDVRWEWYPRPGEILSVSLFYKDIKDAIERRFIDRTGNIVTFTNSPKAFVYGLELEGRTTLDWLDPSLRHFSLGGNVSLIKSETDVLPDVQDSLEEFGVRRTKRPLTDQSPYIVNLDLSYDNPHSGTSVSLIYNVFGPRLIISSMNSPDIYEQPAAGLDFVFSQKLGRHTKLKFTAKNLLDPAIEKTYGEEAEQVYSSYTKGMSFGLSFTYDF